MHATALFIVKGSRRQGHCGRCRHVVTWATLAKRGAKNIPLVASPVILRVDHGTNGVSVEVLGFDQIHRCPVPARPAARPTHRMAPRHVPKHTPAESAYASFTPDRIQQLREQIAAPKPKPPQPSRLW